MFAEYEVQWGGRRLVYSLVHSDARRLRIVVRPDGTLSVFAPRSADAAAVMERVQRRGDWIVRQLDRFARWRPKTPPRQYVSGETHLFQGRQLRLRVVPADVEGVAIDGDRLVVAIEQDAAPGHVRIRVLQWYMAQAKRLLRERYQDQSEVWRGRGLNVPGRLVVRTLANRWGSLTAKGALVLSADLVRASPRLVDYVIAHEIAHVAHPDHGPEWQALMSKMLQDWRERKARLEQQLM